ncbi:MAG: hypothetical protein QF450_09065 [Rhodospirillales bacterium]|nr:hypothetical protein [Rhodospirillales bacterium]HJO72989.1 hypothetical protein [Rhodospirillales bacterium]
MSRTLAVDGVGVPRFLYGTTWKEDDSVRLTALATSQGSRGNDTANQPKHYHEAAIGQGTRRAVESGLVGRGELFLQTKLTFAGGKGHCLPYNLKVPVAARVE